MGAVLLWEEEKVKVKVKDAIFYLYLCVRSSQKRADYISNSTHHSPLVVSAIHLRREKMLMVKDFAGSCFWLAVFIQFEIGQRDALFPPQICKSTTSAVKRDVRKK